ncbi:hypothetical protein HDU96_007374 [Phlyctochytrium bullatum]|nr:hypothetical protein HDU96_007374 [Phlyctochytrium bullatum]
MLTVLQNICKVHMSTFISKVLQECGKVLLDQASRQSFLKRLRNPNIDGLRRKEILKSLNKACKKASRCPHCRAVNGTVKKVGALKVLHEKWKKRTKADDDTPFRLTKRRESFNNALKAEPGIKAHISKAQEDLNPVSVLKLFQQVSSEDCELLENSSNEDDITVLVSEIIHINTLLRGIILEGAHFQSLMTLKKIKKGFCQRLKGKHGRFRGNLSGKRVDFSARTVISPDPNLSIDQVAVPERVAKVLTYPERVTEHNIERLRRNVLNGTDKHPGAAFVQTQKGFKKFLKYGKREEIANDLRIGDIVERHIDDGDIVLFNRQPSLHKLSIMSHFVYFDGDEMNLHVPQTEEARTEAVELMGVKNNLVTPRNGEPLIAATQDFITASFLQSKKDVFYDRSQFTQICSYMFNALMDVDLPPPTILKPQCLWTDDVQPGEILKEAKERKVKDGYDECDNLIAQAKNGELQSQPGCDLEQTLEALEDLTCHYDRSVRDATGGVVQYVYGDDGLDPAKIEGSNLPVEFTRAWMHCTAQKPDPSEVPLNPAEITEKVKSARDFFCKNDPEESLTGTGTAKQFYELIAKYLQDNVIDVQEKLDGKLPKGTAVGAVGAQSIGEPGTQMTLKTFHFAGVASMNVTLGVPRIKEIINASKKIATPIIKACLVEKTDMDERAARVVKGRIEKTTLEDVIVQATSLKRQVTEYIEEVILPEDCYLRIKIDVQAIIKLQLEVNLDTIVTSLLRAKKLKLNEMGIATVNRAVISKVDPKGKKLQLLVEGDGLLAVMGTEGIDGRQTKSNSTLENFATLGIEAARNTIIEEIVFTMESHGMTIDRRHVMLLADLMTFKGEVLGITRFGIAKMKDSVLMLASFEKTTDHLFEASFHGKRDRIDGVSECIIMGIPMRIGSGLFKVLQRSYKDFRTYLVVTGENGVGKSCLIDSATSKTPGVISVTAFSGQSLETIVKNTLQQLTHIECNLIPPFGSAERVVFFYRLLTFGRSPIVVINAAERRADLKYADLTGAARTLVEDYKLRVIIHGSPNSVNPSLFQTHREIVLHIEPMTREMVWQMHQLQDLFKYVKDAGLDDLVFAVLGGIPANYQRLWSCNKAELRNGRNPREVIGTHLCAEIFDAISVIQDSHGMNSDMGEIIKLFDKDKEWVLCKTLAEKKLRRPTPDKVFREVEREDNSVLIPASNAIGIVLRHSLAKKPSLTELEALLKAN